MPIRSHDLLYIIGLTQVFAQVFYIVLVSILLDGIILGPTVFMRANNRKLYLNVNNIEYV